MNDDETSVLNRQVNVFSADVRSVNASNGNNQPAGRRVDAKDNTRWSRAGGPAGVNDRLPLLAKLRKHTQLS